MTWKRERFGAIYEVSVGTALYTYWSEGPSGWLISNSVISDGEGKNWEKWVCGNDGDAMTKYIGDKNTKFAKIVKGERTYYVESARAFLQIGCQTLRRR
jgi:hypothetical protein